MLTVPHQPGASNPLPSARRRRALPLLLKRKVAAKYLGIALATLDRLHASGAIPAGIRVGGARMFRRHELAAWVRHGCPARPEWRALWAALNPAPKHATSTSGGQR